MRRSRASQTPSTTLEERTTLLARLPMFRQAPAELLASLASELEEHRVEAGRNVIKQGRIPTHFYVVGSGTLDVLSSGERGDLVHVDTLTPPSSFGEIGLVEGMPSTATVRAASDCELYRVRGDRFLRTVDASPQLLNAVQDAIAQRLARTHPSYRPAVAERRGDERVRDLLRPLADLATDLGPALVPAAHEELLRAITVGAMELLNSAACSLSLLDANTDELVFKAAAGAGAEQVIGMRVPTGRGLAGASFRSGEAIEISEVARDERFAADVAASTGYQPKSIVVFPLKTDRGCIGVMQALDSSRRDAAAALDVFARLAALAIEQSHRFSDLGRILFDAAARAAADLELSRALEEVAREQRPPRHELAELTRAFHRLSNVTPDRRAAALEALERILG